MCSEPQNGDTIKNPKSFNRYNVVGCFYIASKGQKFKQYKPELKVQILKEYKEGDTSIYILARKYKINVSTIKNWLRKARKDLDIKLDYRKARSGRKSFTREDLKEQIDILKKFQAFLEAQNDKK